MYFKKNQYNTSLSGLTNVAVSQPETSLLIVTASGKNKPAPQISRLLKKERSMLEQIISK